MYFYKENFKGFVRGNRKSVRFQPSDCGTANLSAKKIPLCTVAHSSRINRVSLYMCVHLRTPSLVMPHRILIGKKSALQSPLTEV